MSRVPSHCLIELDEATKSFPRRDASPLEILHPTTLGICRGERVAIVGPSGSGKSTLLSILGTLSMPTAGELRYDGASVTTMGERRRSALRADAIGFVFQQFHLIDTVSALENVTMALQYTRVPRRERRDRAADALERVGLAERMGHRPPQLSGGEQQRVAIARALVKEPDVIFADEPTGALDTGTGHAIVDLLLEVAKTTRMALVVVTHDPSVAARFGRILHIQDGRVTETSADSLIDVVSLRSDDTEASAASMEPVAPVKFDGSDTTANPTGSSDSLNTVDSEHVTGSGAFSATGGRNTP